MSWPRHKHWSECERLALSQNTVLDNQASVAYKKAIGNSDMTCELVPPDDHQHNMAKKAIQTFKDHFVGVLSGCGPTFPMHLWCQLLPQVKRQLLLFQQSRLHPNLSAYAHVYGLWPPQLQQTSICSNRDGGPSTQQITQTANLCRTLKKGVCPWHVHRTQLVLKIQVNCNPSYSNLGRCIFQAQIPA